MERDTLQAHPCALVFGRPWPLTFPLHYYRYPLLLQFQQ
jgi:hypothetical protein